MARLLRFSFGAKVFRFACLLVFLLLQSASFLGQATPCCGVNPQPNTWSPPVSPVNMATQVGNMGNRSQNTFPNPSNTWNPRPAATDLGQILSRAINGPNPNVAPTRQQTEWWVNNNPSLNTLDSALKANLINGNFDGYLRLPVLPNGQPNPFYQMGQITPNWFVPATWSSVNMNWQGVQSSGFLLSYSPSTYSSYKSYNPTSTYNYSYNRSSYNPPTYQQRSTPPRYNTPAAQNTYRQRAFSYTNPSLSARVGRTADLKNAIASRERALAVSQAAGDKVAQVTSHAELARLLVRAGLPDQALTHVKAAEPLAKTAGDTLQRAELLRVKGIAYMATGDFEQAVAAYNESIDMFRSQGNEVDPEVLFGKVEWLLDSTPDISSNYFERTISRLSEPITDPKSWAYKSAEAETFISIGWAYQSMGDVTKALANYKDAKALFTEIGDEDGRVRAQLAIASLYQSIGETQKVIEEYIALPSMIRVNEYIGMLVSVAEILQSLSRPEEALKRYQKAFTLVQSIVDPMQEAVILAGIGRCEMTLGRYTDSTFHLVEAREKMRQAGNRTGEAGVIADLGELHYWQAINSPMKEAKRNFAAALYYYNQALPLMCDVGDRNGEIGVLANTGLLYDAWHKSNVALSYYLQALQKIEELQVSARLEEFRIDVSNQSAGLYQRAIMLEFREHNIQEAFELSERARARAFLDQISAARTESSRRLPAEFSAREEELRKENTLLQRQIRQELSKPGPDINAERLQALQARLAAVRQAYEDAVRDLKISNPDLASLITASPLPLSGIQKQLAPDVTVVSYLTTTDKTLAFVITRNTFDVVKLSVTAPELATAIATFRDFSAESSGTATLKELYKWLLAPLKSHLKTSMLAIVPHGPLNDLPFAALTPDGENFISDKYAVFYLPSVNALPHLHTKSDSGTKPILVMVNDESAGSPRLVYTRNEGRAVANLWHAEPVMGRVATAAYLRSYAGDYGIVHIAAHVATDHEHPQFSTIVTSEGEDDEGELELNQIASLDLRNTNLVVVSGCESQLGQRTRGDDVFSLSRAFMFAGSPSVIASLWNVDDEATQQLMVAFYTHLKAGLSKAEALRAAEIDARKQYPNPYYWAGFVLMGDPGSAGSFNLVASTAK